MSKLVKSYVSEDLKLRLNQHVKSLGASESVSSFVEKLIVEALPKKTTEIGKQEVEEQGSKNLFLRTRVNQAEYDAFQNMKQDLKMKKDSSLLLKLIREAVNGEPDLTDNQLTELRQANQHLLAVGRNLNQIAARVNKDGAENIDPLTIKYMERLTDYIEAQRGAILNMIQFSNERQVKD